RDCWDHHSRTAYSASAIGGGLFVASSASLSKARAVSRSARMRSRSMYPGTSTVTMPPLRAVFGADGNALEPGQPLIPADPVVVHVLRQRNMDEEMIFIVVLADVMEIADGDLRARFDIWHPGSARCHFRSDRQPARAPN